MSAVMAGRPRCVTLRRADGRSSRTVHTRGRGAAATAAAVPRAPPRPCRPRRPGRSDCVAAAVRARQHARATRDAAPAPYMHGVCVACAWRVHVWRVHAWRVHGVCVACAWRLYDVCAWRAHGSPWRSTCASRRPVGFLPDMLFHSPATAAWPLCALRSSSSRCLSSSYLVRMRVRLGSMVRVRVRVRVGLKVRDRASGQGQG